MARLEVARTPAGAFVTGVISESLLAALVVAEVIVCVVALAAATVDALWHRSEQRRALARQPAGRLALAAFLAGTKTKDEVVGDLGPLPRRFRARLLEDLAPSLQGTERGWLAEAAAALGIVAYADRLAASRRWRRRLRGARLLSLYGGGNRLRALLADPSPRVRAQALQWAGDSQDVELAQALVAALDDPSLLCRYSAKDAGRPRRRGLRPRHGGRGYGAGGPAPAAGLRVREAGPGRVHPRPDGLDPGAGVDAGAGPPSGTGGTGGWPTSCAATGACSAGAATGRWAWSPTRTSCSWSSSPRWWRWPGWSPSSSACSSERSDGSFALLFFLVAYGYGICLIGVTVLMEEIAFHRYEALRSRAGLFAWALLESLGYRQLTVFWRLRGLVGFLRKRSEWGAMERRGSAADEFEPGGERRPARLGWPLLEGDPVPPVPAVAAGGAASPAAMVTLMAGTATVGRPPSLPTTRPWRARRSQIPAISQGMRSSIVSPRADQVARLS